MRSSLLLVTGLAALALLFGGCAQGPGHTRAAGAVGGTAAGALLGAAVSPCNRGAGALVGGALGLVAGSIAGDGIACDQERGCGPCGPPCGGCGGCGQCCPPQPCPPPRARPCPPPGGWYYVPPQPGGYYYYGP